MAQVSVDRVREGRVLGVDMMESPLVIAQCTRGDVWDTAAWISREGVKRRRD